MKERFKSFLLVLLISSSLFQSYQLAYSQPRLDPMRETEYIETEILGEQQELSQMLFPQRIMLHSSDKHAVLHQDVHFFNLIFNKVKNVHFSGIREVNNRPYNQRENTQGIELYFQGGIPWVVLRDMLQLNEEMLFYSGFIQRIELKLSEDRQEVRALFYADADASVLEAARVDLTVRELEQFIGFAEGLPAVEPMLSFYRPLSDIEVIRYRIPYDQYSPNQLETSLFVDPSINRSIPEREGTEIITDGKRGLRIHREQAWISYFDPVAVVEFGNDVRENLSAAVQFINRHGGWNGTYWIHVDPVQRSQSFQFQQMYGALSILPAPNQSFGYMRIVLQKGLVSNYERSLINLKDEQVEKELVTLPGGERLLLKLDAYEQKEEVTALVPAYYPVVTEEYVDLIPRWAVWLQDGSYEYLP